MPTYRYEISGTNRASCANSACKVEKIKIQKGEFRFGSLFEIQGHQSWSWKHWGCVTPKQIKNVQVMIEGLEYNDDDLEVLDGWEDLPDWARDKVKEALTVGHVADEDWKGDPELNRPGKSGINKRTPKKKHAEDGDGEVASPEGTPSKPKPKMRGKRPKVEEELGDNEEATRPKRKRESSKKRKAGDENEDYVNGEQAAEPKPKQKSRAKKVKTEEHADEGVADLPEEKVTRKPRAGKIKREDPETRIDDVPQQKPARSSRAKRIKLEKDEDGASADVPDMETLPEQKPARSVGAKKIKAEVEAIHTPVDAPEAMPVRKRRGKKATKKEPTPEPEKEKDPDNEPVIRTELDAAAEISELAAKPVKTKRVRTTLKRER